MPDLSELLGSLATVTAEDIESRLAEIAAESESLKVLLEAVKARDAKLPKGTKPRPPAPRPPKPTAAERRESRARAEARPAPVLNLGPGGVPCGHIVKGDGQ